MKNCAGIYVEGNPSVKPVSGQMFKSQIFQTQRKPPEYSR
jgi:hypothetical protein